MIKYRTAVWLEKTTFKGKVFMTHPTKAIYQMLLSDYVKVSNISVDEILYTEKDLQNSMKKIEVIDYHQEKQYHGIKFWCYNAGHVLGAAMFNVEIGGVRILYTGDYSREEDRHLMAAELPSYKPDVLIIESTYGVQVHEARLERERQFTEEVKKVLLRGGRCLIPVFALGRAQELLLILDEFWAANPLLQKYNIFYASSLAKKCLAVYRTYTNMMNERIRKKSLLSNPFYFKHISNLKGIDDFVDNAPCVVMVTSFLSITLLSFLLLYSLYFYFYFTHFTLITLLSFLLLYSLYFYFYFTHFTLITLLSFPLLIYTALSFTFISSLNLRYFLLYFYFISLPFTLLLLSFSKKKN